MWMEHFGTQTGVCLIQALCLIFGPLNTGFTVTSSNVLTLNSNVNAGFWSGGHLVGSHFVLGK